MVNKKRKSLQSTTSHYSIIPTFDLSKSDTGNRSLFIRILSLTVVFLLFSIFSCQKKADMFVIKGKVLGADEQPPPLAHIHAVVVGQNPFKAKYMAATDEDGRYELELPKGKLWTLMVTAVNHTPLQMPLVLQEEPGEVTINFRLTANIYRDDFTGVKIIGDWNKFNFTDAQAMVPMADGTYAFEIYIAADTVGYQIVNATITDRSINGTMAGRYRYDGGGDYISVLDVKKGMVKIKFDPSKLLRGEPGDIPEIVFKDDKGYLNEVMKIVARAESERVSATIAMQKNLNNPEYRYDFTEAINFFEKYMSKKPRRLAQFAALYYVELIYHGMQPDSSNFKKVTDLMPLDDPLWAIKPYLLVDVYHIALGEDKARELFRQQKDRIANRQVKGFILVDLGMAALADGDMELLKKIYNDLILNYSDIPPLVPAIKHLNPDQQIMKGQLLPDFQIKLLKRDRWITREDLKGKYYLLHFWATWEEAAVKQIPQLINVYKTFPHNKFNILSISLDLRVKTLRQFHKEKWNMPWWNSFIHELYRHDIRNIFRVRKLPYFLLVDPDGKIIALNSDLQGDNLLKTLRRLVK